jgi:hypothetical protein
MNEADLKSKLADPWWRLTSGVLYKIMIKGDDGEESLVLPFIPNASQLILLKDIHNRNIILKARQLGFTTLIAIYFLDCALFRENIRAGIVAQSEDVAKTIFRDKVQFAYNNLPEQLREAMPLGRDSQSELLFAHNNSSIRVATSMRSGTLQYLHVSEFGKIGAKFPDRAKEVVTGSIPAVPSNGVVFIESTAEGQEGEFFKMTDRARKNHESGKRLGKKDFKFHFFPWWVEDKYRLKADDVIITDKDNEYFDKIEEQAGCTIDLEQRAWWVSTRDSEFSGEDEKMWQEYPSTPKEAFQRSTEGCYYTVQMTSARKQGRITRVAHNPSYPVNTFWDIGHGDGTAIWLHQRIGQSDNFIGFIEAWGEPYSYFVSELQKKGYVWGSHYLPHDGAHVRQGMLKSLSPKQMLEQLGLKNIEIVKCVDDISHGIQEVRNRLSSCWFDETECKDGIVHLDNYKKQWSTTNQRFTDHPKHDVHSEGADAFRQWAQGFIVKDKFDLDLNFSSFY